MTWRSQRKMKTAFLHPIWLMLSTQRSARNLRFLIPGLVTEAERGPAGKHLVDLLEIDVPLLHICVDELHPEPVAHIDAFIPVE